MNYVLFLLSTLLIAKHSSTKTIYQHFVTADWTFKPHAHVRTFHTDCLMVMDIICQPRVQNVFVWVCSALYLFFAFLFSFIVIYCLYWICFPLEFFDFCVFIFPVSPLLYSLLSFPPLAYPSCSFPFRSKFCCLNPIPDCKIYETLEFPPPLLLAALPPSLRPYRLQYLQRLRFAQLCLPACIAWIDAEAHTHWMSLRKELQDDMLW